MTKIKLASVYISLFVMLASCASPPPIPEVLFTATSTQTPILSAPDATLTTNATQILIPTLPKDDAGAMLLELLATNGNCQLPCIWGITPGKSTYAQALDLLTPLKSISNFTSLNTSPGDISPEYIQGDKILDTRFAFLYSETEIVSRISFQAKVLNESVPLDLFDNTPLRQNIQYYMLSSVLSKLGVPESVVMSISTNPSNPDAYAGFEMVLIYPELGVLAHYTTQRQLGNDILYGCFANSAVELELFPAGDAKLFTEGLSSTKWAGYWTGGVNTPYWKSLEKVTDMSLDAFYETFRQPTDKCIETPINIWPTPEPQ